MKLNKIELWLKRQKEGIFAGAVTGAVVFGEYKYGIVERFLVWMNVPLDPVWYGGAIVIFISIAIGALIDSIYQPKR